MDELRRWELHYFRKNSFIFKKLSNQLNKLRDLPENAEFDLVVKILKISQKDEYNLELRIKDFSNEMWFITIPKLKFGRLKENMIVRIRSVNLDITSKRNVIEVSPKTNIMKFTHNNCIIREMNQNIEMETVADQMQLDDYSEVLMTPVPYTEITDLEMVKSPLFKLDDLFLNYDSLPLETRMKNAFRVRFCALKIDPEDPREAVQVLDPVS